MAQIAVFQKKTPIKVEVQPIQDHEPRHVLRLDTGDDWLNVHLKDLAAARAIGQKILDAVAELEEPATVTLPADAIAAVREKAAKFPFDREYN